MNITFVGHVSFDTEGKNFIKDVKKLLRCSGYRLWLRGGNPNRKQFNGTPNGYGYKHTTNSLRASLPIKFATYVRLYLRETGTGNKSAGHCKGIVDAVRQIHIGHGKNLTKNVPKNLKKVVS